jgi:hypothetical protein
MKHRLGDEVIAGLQALGVTKAEIADLLAQEALVNPTPTVEQPSRSSRDRLRNRRAHDQALIQRGSLTSALRNR